MTGAYDDRDGVIWMDGALKPWREAQVHIMTHALHYGPSVIEGERAYNGRMFESRKHAERLLFSGREMDIPIPYTVDEIEAAKAEALAASGLSDAYVRAVCWRGSGEDMGVAAARNAVRMAALMECPNILVYTHDSIGLGEDGPTHQPIEHVASLRLMPNLDVWRPADTTETLVAWIAAIEHRTTPTDRKSVV